MIIGSGKGYRILTKANIENCQASALKFQHERLSSLPAYPHFYASKEARRMRTATLRSSAHLQFAPDDRADPRLFGAPGPTWTGAPPAWTSLTATTMEMCSHGQFSRIHGQFGFFAEVLQIEYFPLHLNECKNDHILIKTKKCPGDGKNVHFLHSHKK